MLERLEPIDREQGAGRTLREQLVLVLRKAILEATLPPGGRLIETSLADQLGVSRGPLREAIRQLVEEGLVDQVPFRGAVVRSLSVEDIQEIYSFRTLLESFAFKVVWDRRTPEFFRMLDSRHRALNYAVYSGDQQQAITREMDLHGLVYEFSKHRSLIESWNLLRGGSTSTSRCTTRRTTAKPRCLTLTTPTWRSPRGRPGSDARRGRAAHAPRPWHARGVRGRAERAPGRKGTCQGVRLVVP